MAWKCSDTPKPNGGTLSNARYLVIELRDGVEGEILCPGHEPFCCPMHVRIMAFVDQLEATEHIRRALFEVAVILLACLEIQKAQP